MLAASVIAGELWDHLGSAFTFYTEIAFALVALTALVMRERKA